MYSDQASSSERPVASPNIPAYTMTRRSRLPSLFFFQAEDGIRDDLVTGVQTCALPISLFPPDAERRIGAAAVAGASYALPAELHPHLRRTRLVPAGVAVVAAAALARRHGLAAGGRKSLVEGKRGEFGGCPII